MSEIDQQTLEGISIGVLVAPDGTGEVAFTEPKRAVPEAGAAGGGAS